MLADVGTGTDPGLDESFADEPVVGDTDSVARDREPPGQLPARRNDLASLQTAVQDGVADLLVYLAHEVTAAFQADVDVHPGA